MVSTVILVASMVLVARALDGALALPLGLTSAVCTTAIMFVFPGMCASCVHKSIWGKVLPVTFAVAGLLIGTASTVIWREGRLKNGFERPVVIHRAILGSVERMSAILMEHYAGKWPFWLSPRQVKVVPVGTQFNEYAVWVERQLQIYGFYAEAETSGKTLNKKVREAQLEQWNYVAVVGAEEQNALSVNLRSRESEKPLGAFSMIDFIAKLDKEAMPSSQPLRQFEAFQGRLPEAKVPAAEPAAINGRAKEQRPAFQKQGSLQANDKFASLSVDDDVEAFLEVHPYVKGFEPSSADAELFEQLSESGAPETPNLRRGDGTITWSPSRPWNVRRGRRRLRQRSRLTSETRSRHRCSSGRFHH
eukprot:s645_g14.t1